MCYERCTLVYDWQRQGSSGQGAQISLAKLLAQLGQTINFEILQLYNFEIISALSNAIIS